MQQRMESGELEVTFEVTVTAVRPNHEEFPGIAKNSTSSEQGLRESRQRSALHTQSSSSENSLSRESILRQIYSA